MRYASIFCLMLSLCAVQIQTAKILGIFHLPSVSHVLVYMRICKELSLRGHEVVVVTPNPINDPTLINLTEIDIGYLYKHPKPEKGISLSYTSFFVGLYHDYGFDMAEYVLKDERIQRLCSKDDENFDIVMAESFYPLWLKFGARCKASLIGMNSADAMMSTHRSQGNMLHPALFGGFMMDFSRPLSIWKKLEYSYYFVWYRWFHKKYILASSDYLMDKYIDKRLPRTEDLERNVSLVLINNNFLISPPQPLAPSTILVGFLHVKHESAPSELTKDLQSILDNAKDGVVYFSLGSNVKSSGLPVKTLTAIKEALSELPYTVLWKWETDDVPALGRNVFTRKWFPQQDVLAHPNVKGFVTQGGLQSTEEAIIYGVPMVGIPFFSDQEMNVRKSERLGITIHIDKNSITKSALKEAVMKIMTDSSYTQKIKELQKIAKDQPMSGLDRAVWWTEYVIRHKGAPHLRSPAADISLFEYLLLDVILVVLAVVILVSFIFYKIVKIFSRMLRSNLQSKIKKT